MCTVVNSVTTVDVVSVRFKIKLDITWATFLHTELRGIEDTVVSAFSLGLLRTVYVRSVESRRLSLSSAGIVLNLLGGALGSDTAFHMILRVFRRTQRFVGYRVVETCETFGSLERITDAVLCPWSWSISLARRVCCWLGVHLEHWAGASESVIFRYYLSRVVAAWYRSFRDLSLFFHLSLRNRFSLVGRRFLALTRSQSTWKNSGILSCIRCHLACHVTNEKVCKLSCDKDLWNLSIIDDNCCYSPWSCSISLTRRVCCWLYIYLTCWTWDLLWISLLPFRARLDSCVSEIHFLKCDKSGRHQSV